MGGRLPFRRSVTVDSLWPFPVASSCALSVRFMPEHGHCASAAPLLGWGSVRAQRLDLLEMRMRRPSLGAWTEF
jgi:hypothetical protein